MKQKIKLAIKDLNLKKWGYIYHRSKLSDSYLRKTLPAYDIIAMTGWKIDEYGKIKI